MRIQLLDSNGGRMKHKCFECGTMECIQHHHVIPRSLGGTKTIPLCSICHGKVHGIKRDKQINVSELTKEGLKRAKANGVVLGNPRLSEAAVKGKATQLKEADDFALKMEPIIGPMLRSGLGYTGTAKTLNNAKIKTRRGKTWTPTSVRNLFKRLKNLEEQ